MAPLLLRALVALLCVLTAAAQVPVPGGCANVEERCTGAYSLDCCPGKYLICDAKLGRCLYTRAAGGAQGRGGG